MRALIGAALVACVGVSAGPQGQGGVGRSPIDTAMAGKVDAVFAPYTASHSPGCAVAVTRNGAMLFTKGYGLADLEHDVPITPDTLFYVASVSKQFTGISLGLLIQRGVISINDDIRKYVPEMPDFGTPITIAHVLHHTSGVRDYLGLQELAGFPEDEPLTEAGFLAIMARQQALNFAPGSEHLYSNSGYALLATIVKRASGLSLKDFAAKEVLGPLGMTTSQFRDDHTVPVPNRAVGYAPHYRVSVNGPPPALDGYRQRVPMFDIVGDGGLFSSARELALWDPTDLPASLGAPGLSALLTAPGRLNDGTSIPYAMGLRLATYRGLPIVRHGGAYGGYQTDVTRFPGERMGVTVLCNLTTARPWQWGERGLAQQVADVVFADQFTEPPSQAIPAGTVGSWPGVVLTDDPLERMAMFSEELDSRWTISLWRIGLRLQRRNSDEIVFNRISGTDTFRAPTMTIHLTRDAGGSITGMTVDAGRVKGLRFLRLPA